MRRHLKLFLLIISFSVSFALMPNYSDAHLVRTSDRIVVAKIIEKGDAIRIAGRGICTPWTIMVEKYVVGDGEQNIIFYTHGGYLLNEGKALWVEDQPIPNVGEEAVIFLEKIDNLYWVNGLVLGYRRISQDGTLRNVSLNEYVDYLRDLACGIDVPFPETETSAHSASPMGITSINPTEGPGGDGSVTLIISGSGFGTTIGTVEFTYYQWPGEGPNFLHPSWTTIYSWTDTEIRTNIAENGSSGPIRVTPWGGSGMVSSQVFHVWFGYANNRWGGLSPVVTLKHNDSTFPVSGCLTAILNAMNTWSTAGARFQYVDGGTTTDGDAQYDGAANGTNAIHFGRFPGTSAPLGQCMTHMSGPPWYITEMDIRLNIEETWSAGDPVYANDVETCCLHEMGHGFGLLDLYGLLDEGKVMYGVSLYGSALRTLHPRDRQGIQYIYGTVNVDDGKVLGQRSLNVYPNPAFDDIRLSFVLPTSGHTEISMLDISGRTISAPFRKMLKAGENNINLNISDVPAGMYLVKVSCASWTDAKWIVCGK